MYESSKKFLLILLLLLFCTGEVKSQILTTLTITGDWDLYITQADLQGGAGSNLNGTYTSDPGDCIYSQDIKPGIGLLIYIDKMLSGIQIY